MGQVVIALLLVLTELLEPARAVRQEQPGVPANQRVPSVERVLVRGRAFERDGRPIAGAEVFVAPPCGVPREEWNLIPFESERPERRQDFARALSAEDGSFELAPVRASELHLALRAPGHVGLDRVCELAAGVSELDLGTLVLERGAVVSGSVVDEAGLPVPGARVLRQGVTEFTRKYRIDWSEVVLARCTTDGTFRLEELALDPILLEVRAPGFVRERYELRAGKYTNKEWRVVLERASLITGRVVGAPAESEIKVHYRMPALDEDEPYSVPCAADGSFAVDGISASLSPIELYAVRRRAAGMGIDLEAIAFPDWERISLGVSVNAGTSGVEVRVPAPITYRLRVIAADTQDPLSGVRVGLLEGLDIESPLPDGMRVEAPGVYSFSMLRPWASEERALAVSREGYERVAVGELPFVPGTPQDIDVVLTRLVPTQVRVSTSDDRPVSGAALSAMIQTNDEGCLNAHMVGPWPARSVLPDGWSGTSSADGTATAYLSPGKVYWFRVEHGEHPLLWEQVDTRSGAPARLDLRLLREGSATVTLLCIDARTRRPLPGESIRYDHSCAEGSTQVWTGVDGRIRLERLVPCSYRFWSANDGGRSEVFVDVDDGADLEVTLAIGAR